MPREVYRKVSLERLSSPEQLDQLMTVTTRRGWVALAAVGVLLATAIAWGIAGSIPTRVNGTGILIRSGGVFEVSAPTGGRVADLSVQVGDVITEGQVVARLAQPELADNIAQARARLQELEARQRELSAFAARDGQLQTSSFAERRLSLEQAIANSQRMLSSLEERIRSQERLVQQGLITRQALLATVQERDAVQDRILATRAQLQELGVERLQEGNTTQEKLQEGTARLEEARHALAALENQMRLSSEVTSPFTGRVLELMAEQGGMVDRGHALLTIDLTGKTVQDLEAVVYIPSLYGKKVKPGMEIQISPSTVKKEEYGFLLGRVTYVSDFPATPEGMRRTLKNEQLVGTLAGHDAPFEVHADLLPNPDNVSSYRWSSSSGPPIRIQSGTLVGAGIVVERRRPVTMVIPQLRRLGVRGGRADGRVARR
jgi:HlyD family secretion protein